MSRWLRRLRSVRRALWRLAVAVVILAGLAVAVLTQFLPGLESRPVQVAAFLERQLGVPIQLQRVQAAWVGGKLRLQVGGLRVGGEHGPSVSSAVLWVRPFTGWWPGGAGLTSLHIERPQLDLEASQDGRWSVRGLGLGRDEAGSGTALLDAFDEVVLDHAVVRLRDPRTGLELDIPRVDLRLRGRGREVELGVHVFADSGAPVQVRARIAKDLSAGTAYLRLRHAPLALWWARLLPAHRPGPEAEVSGELWVDWTDRRPSEVQFGLELEPLADAAAPARLEGRWRADADGGEMQVIGRDGRQPRGWGRFRHAKGPRSLEITDLDLGTWWTWLERLRLALQEPERPVPPQALELAGTIAAMRVDWSAEVGPRGWATVQGFGLAGGASAPRLEGLDLRIEGDGERARIDLAASRLHLAWSSLEGPLEPRVEGTLMLWREPEAGPWCLHALQLALVEPDYAFTARGGLCSDGGAPYADLQVAVAPAEVTTARRFWMRDRMPEPVVRWLDEALVGGRVAGGAVLVHGDLGHWPFRDGEGRFEAEALLDQVRLRFRPDWPDGEALSGVARFVNDGMEVEGRATIAGIEVERLAGRIPRYRDARLQLDLGARSQGRELLGLLRASPLWDRLGKGLGPVRIEGPANVDLSLDIPLRRGRGEVLVRGELRLDEADLRYEEWGIALDAARGPVAFTGHGLHAEALEVLHGGRPARFSLRIGDRVRDPAHLLEAGLEGRMQAALLLDSQPDLDGLRPLLDGVSNWSFALSIPQKTEDPAVLSVASDLVGTRLRLPAPLRKSPATPMPLELAIELGQVERPLRLRLGELLRLEGRWRPGGGLAGLAAFGGAADGEPPAQGLRVVGTVPVLDLGGWMSLRGGEGGRIESVDLSCGELSLFGRSLGELRLRYEPGADPSRIVFEGTQVEGEIEVPKGTELAQRGITARFERLYWPESARPASEESVLAALHPASVPPLHLHVRDLRLGTAVLGETRFESFPQGDAMQIEQFRARSPAFSLDARGRWEPGGPQGRSQLQAEFTAEDLGRMLGALGFAELVEGGQTLATLEGRWAGPPTAFALERIDGRLSISVGQGRIPEVDPGAGRLFGLLSLTEIPRRLALDFSDFFRSGLAFNRIEGEFQLGDGQARTDRLSIDCPSAEIVLRGVTDLARQRYAQTMEVLPRAGNMLAVVGALTAGPAGAAVGAVAQAVLQNPLQQITRTLYAVKGPWSEPVIEVLERGPARSADGEAPPP